MTKKSISRNVFLVVLLLIFLSSCSQKQQIPEEFSLESPNGYVLAENFDELYSLLNISKESEILKIDYMETDQATLGFVTYKEENGEISTVAVGSGDFKFDANEIDVQPTLKNVGGAGTVTVTCSGTDNCLNCGVRGTIVGGEIHVECESSCCIMHIKGASSVLPCN